MKKRKAKRKYVGGATTTSKDWGFGPVAGKGGKTRNGEIPPAWQDGHKK